MHVFGNCFLDLKILKEGIRIIGEFSSAKRARSLPICCFFFPKNALFFIQTSPPPKLPPKTCKKQSQFHRKSSITATFSLRLQFTQNKKKHSCNVSTPSLIVDFRVCFYPRFYEIPPTLQTLSPKALASEASNIKYQTTTR